MTPGSTTPVSGGKAISPPALLIDFALLSVVLMWASTFTLFKIAWRDVDPVAFTAVRFGAMFLFSVAILTMARNRTRPTRRDLPLLAASGLTGYFLYQMGFILGLDRTTALASAILISTHPIFSVIVAWMARKEKPTPIQVGGVVLAFLGVAVFLGAWDAFAAARWGDLLSLGAAAAFGVYSVITQSLSDRFSSQEVMSYGLAIGGLLVTVVGIPAMVSQDWSGISLSSWAILLYAIVGPVYLAYLFWNWAIRHRGVARTVVFGFLVPVVAGVMAVLALDETVQARELIGGLVVLAGLLVTRLARSPAVVAAPAAVVPPAEHAAASVSERA